MGTLERRLVALEASTPPVETAEAPRTDYAALQRAFDKILAKSKAPKPAGLDGVRHYRREIAEAERWTTVVPPPDEPGKTNWPDLRAQFAPKLIPGYRHELRRCELDVLTAHAFDADRLGTWRAAHERFACIPWQWRGEDLPADAIAVINAALARENSGAFQ